MIKKLLKQLESYLDKHTSPWARNYTLLNKLLEYCYPRVVFVILVLLTIAATQLVMSSL